MKREVDAVYEGGVFRPVTSVGDLPEHAHLRLTIELIPQDQAAPQDVEARIAEIERLAEAAFGALTPDEEAALRVARKRRCGH